MKPKNIVRFFGLSFFLFFMCIYIFQATGYYEASTGRKTALTSDAIKRFEEDLKSGENLENRNYLEPDKNYNNSLYRIGITSSNVIEKSFNKIMNYILKEVGETVNKK